MERINCPAVHCLIHQQALFSKRIGMNSTMNIAVKIINKIRGAHNALTHRKFKNIRENLNSECFTRKFVGSVITNTQHNKPIFLFFYFLSVRFSKMKLNFVLRCFTNTTKTMIVSVWAPLLYNYVYMFFYFFYIKFTFYFYYY